MLELTLERPLALSEAGVQLQLTVSAAGERSERSLVLHARQGSEAWQRHASARLGMADAHAPLEAVPSWPPPDTEPVELAGFYAGLRERGLDYGPSFQGLAEPFLRDPFNNDDFSDFASFLTAYETYVGTTNQGGGWADFDPVSAPRLIDKAPPRGPQPRVSAAGVHH